MPNTLEKTMLDQAVWAVVGANQDRSKFGNKIYRRLKERGYEVYAVNPGLETVEGDPCYKDLSSLPKVPDVIDMVINPQRGLPVIEEAAKLGVPYVWLQPGTYDVELMQKIDELGLKSLQACVLVST